MAAPAAPFCTTADVASLHPQLLNQGTDFTDGPKATSPAKSVITAYITLISNQALMKFRRAGYKIPFVELAGETWPTDQTVYMQLLTMLGVSGLMAGPSISNPGVRGRQNNVFKEEFLQALNEIYDPATDVAMPWRAQYYSRTAAERAIGTPALPMTDYLNETYDPYLHYSFYDLTTKIHSVHRIFKDVLDLDWDYSWGLNDLNKGIGREIREL